MLDIDIDIRIVFPDTFFNRSSNTACNTVATSGSGRILHFVLWLYLFELDTLCFKHTNKFFKCDNKIHIGTHCTAGSLQLFGCTRSDKDNAGIRMFFFDHTGSCHHRCECIGNLVDRLREEFFSKH